MLNLPEEIIEQKTSDVAILTLRKDGVITFEPKEGVLEHNIETMKIELEIFKIWAGDKKLGFITDNRNLKKFDAEVRVYAQQHLHLFCEKFAVIISSGISSFLTNMFIHLNRPKTPIKTFINKTFINKTDAIQWLKS